MNSGFQQLDGITLTHRSGATEATLTSPLFALQNTTLTNDMGADGYSWSQAIPLIIDAHNKLFAIAEKSSGDHNFVYCNNPETTTPLWFDNTGYSDEIALLRGTAVLDATNDVIHVLWVATGATDGVIYRRYTINRDGSNNITSISKDTSVNLQLDFETTGSMQYQHPIMLHMNDGGGDGTYGKLFALWAARNSTGSGNELRASMCVLGATADRGKTAGNWVAPVVSDTTGIGNAPQVAYSIIDTNTHADVMYPSAARKAATKDVYVFYADGNEVWKWLRLDWNSTDWSSGITTPATVTAIQRAGTDTGYNLKAQVGTKPQVDATLDRVYFGFASWKDNTNGDTWSFVYVDNTDTLSAINDIYSANGAHSYAPVGDIQFDSTSHRLAVSYIKTSTQHAYVQLYNGLTQTQSEAILFATEPVDIPLISNRFSTELAPFLFRDTNTPHKGWYGTMLWPSGSRSTPSAPNTPDDITGLLFWYKTPISGATNNVSITTWPDSSININNATPNATGLIYRTNVINSLPVVENAGDYAAFSSVALGTAHTVFIVLRPIVSFSDGVLIGGNANGKYTSYLDTTDIYYRAVSTDAFVTVAHGGLTINTPYLITVRRSGTSVSFYKNGVQIGTTQTLAANTSLTVTELFGTAGGNFPPNNMQFAEIFVFDTALSIDDRQAMDTYVSTRFAFF